jgi:hypothetical protein
MGLIQKAKDALGIGPSPEERYQQAAQDLSDTYPDTPDGTYRCGECKEIKSISTVGGQGLGKTEDGELTSVVFCDQCSRTE